MWWWCYPLHFVQSQALRDSIVNTLIPTSSDDPTASTSTWFTPTPLAGRTGTWLPDKVDDRFTLHSGDHARRTGSAAASRRVSHLGIGAWLERALAQASGTLLHECCGSPGDESDADAKSKLRRIEWWWHQGEIFGRVDVEMRCHWPNNAGFLCPLRFSASGGVEHLVRQAEADERQKYGGAPHRPFH